MDTIIVLLVVTLAGAAVGWHHHFTDYQRTALGDSIDIASMKLLKETFEASNDGNIIASPLGVLSLLSLYASGSEGETRDEVMKLLHSTDYKQLSESYSELSSRFASMDSSYLNLANKVYVSDEYSLDDDFEKTARSYRSEVENINFSDQEAAAEAMNDWASKNTQGKITHPVSPSQITPSTAVALLNVIFFKGHWGVPFNVSETEDKDFYTATAKSVKKPMMHLLDKFNYRQDEELGAQLIELPYKESKFRMIVILPDEVEGLAEVVKKVSQRGLLDDVFKMYVEDVDLDLPKFEIKSKHNLNDILPKVGVESIFAKESEGIVRETGVRVGSAFQEAFVTVDEEGATAAAFTGILIMENSDSFPPPLPISFKVDRPFLFAILYDDIILFAGTYAH